MMHCGFVSTTRVRENIKMNWLQCVGGLLNGYTRIQKFRLWLCVAQPFFSLVFNLMCACNHDALCLRINNQCHGDHKDEFVPTRRCSAVWLHSHSKISALALCGSAVLFAGFQPDVRV